MKNFRNMSLSLGLFLLLSLLLHLAAWAVLSSSISDFLAGLRAPREEVITVMISDPPQVQPVFYSPGPVKEVAAKGASGEAGQKQSHGQPSADNQTASGEAEPEVADEADSQSAQAVPEVPQVVNSPVTSDQPVKVASLEPYNPGVPEIIRTASRTEEAEAPPDILPFARERLTFALYWSGIHVGTATMEAVKGASTSYITSVVNSNAMISAFYKVSDRAESRLVNGRPAGFTLLQQEGRHRRNKETVFDSQRGKVVYINHMDNSRNEHDTNGKLLWDVISGFYYVRRQPLELGKTLYLDMFDSNKFLKTEVKVLRRETVEVDGRDVRTIIVEPVLKSEGLFQKTGEILIWLTDDDVRMPVRMETKLKIGKVTAELKSFSVKNGD